MRALHDRARTLWTTLHAVVQAPRTFPQEAHSIFALMILNQNPGFRLCGAAKL